MEILKISNQAADGKKNVEVDFCKDRIQGVAFTGEPKKSNEEKKIAEREEKYRIINSENILNKMLHEKAVENFEKKQEFEKMLVEKKVYVYKPLNKSQLRTLEIIEEYAEMGIVITKEEAGMIKKEEQIVKKIIYPVQGIHYFKTLEERVGTRGMYIILMAVIWIIKAACPMPENSRAYQIKSVALAKAQTDNTLGYFTVPFAGLALMITNNGLLLAAIVAFEGGTGNIGAVEAAMAVVKKSVDLLVIYVNSLCLANQANAVAIILAAEMVVVKQKPKNTKADFSIAQGATGEIKLVSLAAKFNGKRCPATYYWQYGLMVAGVLVWYDLPETVNRCKTTATGMPLGVAVFFRKRIRTNGGGLSGWSVVKSISPE
jgi:hypothetical protein